jgi:hypothetical protein
MECTSAKVILAHNAFTISHFSNHTNSCYYTVQKIKREIIHKAKLKKNFAKLKAREQAAEPQRSVYEKFDDDEQADVAELKPEPTLVLHPDRQVLLDKTSPEPVERSERPESYKQRKRPKPQPYVREAELAEKHKAEAEARWKAREEAGKQREQKLAERERYRRAMDKARTGGPNGQRKLGRESKVLLEKVKRLVTG